MGDELLLILKVRCFLNDAIEEEAQLIIIKSENVILANISDFEIINNEDASIEVILYDALNIINLLDSEYIIDVLENGDSLKILTDKNFILIEYL